MKTFVHNGKHKIEYSIVNVSELEGELKKMGLFGTFK